MCLVVFVIYEIFQNDAIKVSAFNKTAHDIKLFGEYMKITNTKLAVYPSGTTTDQFIHYATSSGLFLPQETILEFASEQKFIDYCGNVLYGRKLFI
jgi:hypothetical protein